MLKLLLNRLGEISGRFHPELSITSCLAGVNNMEDTFTFADVEVDGVANPGLCELIYSLDHASITSDVLFLSELCRATFIVPVYIRTVKHGDFAIRFPLVKKLFGGQFIAAYTDAEALARWPGDPKRTLCFLDFSDLSSVVRMSAKLSGICLNPGCARLLLSRDDIARADGSLMPKSFQKDETVMLGQPKVFSDGIDKALRRYLSKLSAVRRAYLCLMIRGDYQSYLLIVDCDGDEMEVFEGAADVAAAFLEPGQAIDFAVTESDFGKAAIRGRKPFYVAERLGTLRSFRR